MTETVKVAKESRWRSARRWTWQFFAANDPVIAWSEIAIIIYYCVTPGVFQGKASGDGWFGFNYLPGLFFHHTFDLAASAGQPWIGIFGREITGHVANACPIGPVILWAPFYVLGLALKPLLGLIPGLIQEDAIGRSAYHYWMTGLGSLFFGLAAMGTLYRFLERKLSRGAARFGVLGGIWATPIVWYLVTQPLYQHACAFWAVTTFVDAWDRWRGNMTLKRCLALGALGGVAMLMRLQEAMWLLLPGLDVLVAAALSLTHPSRLRVLARLAWSGVLILGAAFITFIPQLLLWYYYYGHIRTPQPSGHMLWFNPAFIATLFSTRAGLLTWSPILYLFIPGLIALWRVQSGLAWRLGLMFVVGLWVNASAWDHYGSWSYGARRFTDQTVVFALGLAGIWFLAEQARRSRLWRRVLAVALFLAMAGNLVQMEMVRLRKVKSSGGGAFAASTWFKWAGAPAWMGRVFDTVGYPFVQPAGWIYAAIYHVPVATYEGIAGTYILERDWRIHASVANSGVSFAEENWFVVEGVERRGASASASGGRVRVLIPLVESEPLGGILTGSFAGHESEIRLRWNGVPLAATPLRDAVRFAVPENIVTRRMRTNVVEIEGIPAGSQLRRLDFTSQGKWWQQR